MMTVTNSEKRIAHRHTIVKRGGSKCRQQILKSAANAASTALSCGNLRAGLDVSESTMTRKLRQELPSEQRDHILNMIYKLAERKAEQEAEYQARKEEYSDADNANG